MKKIFILIGLLGLFAQGGISQPWLQKSSELVANEGIANIYNLRESFDQWFETHDQGKGTGYKQFQRYLSFMEPRVYPTGEFPEEALWAAYQYVEANRLKSGSFTASWSPIGPFDVPTDLIGDRRAGAGRINCITFHPNDPDIFYVGAPSGGVWKTINGGDDWATTTDQLPALGVSDIAVNPLDPDILYMVTGDKDGGNTCPTYSFGILKSTDAGETWNATGLQHSTSSQQRMRRILVNPSNPDILITAGGPGIFRSTDAGETWEEIRTGDFFDLEFKVDDPNVVFACSGSSVFKSTDSGLSFTQVGEGLPETGVGRTEMAVTHANPEVIYAVMSNSESGFKGLYKSSDAGETWVAKSTEESINIFGYAEDGSGNSGIAWYAIALAIDQEEENIVYSGSVNIWRSMNSGEEWIRVVNGSGDNEKPYVHVDEHTLVVNPLNNICYSGNDGGIYKTPDKGNTWTDISDGLSILQIYRMGASYSNPDIILEGSQDNGTYLYNGGFWNRIAGGDGMQCAVDHVDPAIMYASYQNGSLMRSDNGGQNWRGIRAAENGAWITPFQISPMNHNMIVAGYNSVYLSGNKGDTWHKISDDLAGESFLNEISFAPSNDAVIYVSSESSLWGTKDRGENWEKLSNNLPELYIEGILVAASEPDRVWIAFSGYSDGDKVFFSNDGGENWTNYSEGLPNVPVNCLTVNKLSQYALYAGTDLGVYYRNPDMDEWIPYDDGLPNVIVNTLEINYKVNKIRAATFGRGIWESSIIEDGNWPPAYQLSVIEKPTEISLSWFPPNERTPDVYNIYRDNEFYRTSPTNSFIDYVENGMSYTYQITAAYDDGESTPTNKLSARAIVEPTIPYSENFDTEAHGWLLDKEPSGWQWGTGSTFNMAPLGESNFIVISSVLASQVGKNARGYAILPKMDLLGEENPIISFDYSLRRWQNLDHLYLVYRTPDETSWNNLVEINPSGRTWSWKTFTMQLPDTVLVPSIEFALYYTDSDDIGYGAAIDAFYLGADLTGKDEESLDQNIMIYPNPTEGIVNVKLKGIETQKLMIEILDLSGRTLIQRDIHYFLAGTNEEISIQKLSPGQYLVRITGDEFQWIRPVTRK